MRHTSSTFEFAENLPVSADSSDVGAFGDAPTDYLDFDTEEVLGAGYDQAWSVPGRFLACFRATLDRCWASSPIGEWGSSCARHLSTYAAAVKIDLPVRAAGGAETNPSGRAF